MIIKNDMQTAGVPKRQENRTEGSVRNQSCNFYINIYFRATAYAPIFGNLKYHPRYIFFCRTSRNRRSTDWTTKNSCRAPWMAKPPTRCRPRWARGIFYGSSWMISVSARFITRITRVYTFFFSIEKWAFVVIWWVVMRGSKGVVVSV